MRLRERRGGKRNPIDGLTAARQRLLQIRWDFTPHTTQSVTCAFVIGDREPRLEKSISFTEGNAAPSLNCFWIFRTPDRSVQTSLRIQTGIL